MIGFRLKLDTKKNSLRLESLRFYLFLLIEMPKNTTARDRYMKILPRSTLLEFRETYKETCDPNTSDCPLDVIFL